MGRRQPGSVRFDPYYKLQWWEARSLAWRDVQRSFDELDPECMAEARKLAQEFGKARIMRITPEGREPVQEVSA